VRFEQKLISPGLLFREIQLRGSATTKELKTHFGVDSASIRRSMAPLWAADAIWVVGLGRSTYYMVASGQKGFPQPTKARAAAKRGEYAQPAHPLDFRGEMLKQVLILDSLGWDDVKIVAVPANGGKKVYSFDDDGEAVELDYDS